MGASLCFREATFPPHPPLSFPTELRCPPSPWTHRSGKVRDRAVWDTKRCRCARAEFGSLFSFLAEKKKLGLACGQFPPRDLCLKGPTEKTSGKVPPARTRLPVTPTSPPPPP